MSENTNTKPAKQSWFKGLASEFKKISWPDKKTLAKESFAVVIVTVVLGLIISLVDFVVKYGLDIILALG